MPSLTPEQSVALSELVSLLHIRELAAAAIEAMEDDDAMVEDSVLEASQGAFVAAVSSQLVPLLALPEAESLLKLCREPAFVSGMAQWPAMGEAMGVLTTDLLGEALRERIREKLRADAVACGRVS